MRHLVILCAVLFALQLNAQLDLKTQLASKRVTLPNGWKLSPHGESLALGDLPLHVAVSPNQKYLLVTNNGQSVQSLQLIDVASNQVIDSKELPKSWYGLKVAANNKTVFVSGGNDNVILVFEIEAGKLVEKDKIALTTEKKAVISPAGIEYDDATGILYLVTKENNSLYVIEAKTKTILAIHCQQKRSHVCSARKKIFCTSRFGVVAKSSLFKFRPINS